MAVTVECTSCGKQYNAADSMVGRRIKCRQCGAIFMVRSPQIDAGTEQTDEVTDQSNEDGSSILDGTGASSFAGAAGESEGEDEEGPLAALGRRNVRFTFPYAVVVDRWLPIILTVGGLLWVGAVVFRYDDTNTTWMPIVRVAVMAVLYLALLFPLGLKGIQMAGRDLGFQMPRTDRWRALATFMPVFMVGAVLWIVGGGSNATLLVGLAVGFIISCGVLWLLFRLHAHEIPAAAGYAGGMLLLGLAISVGVLFGLNTLLNSVLVSLHKADQVPGSPFAMALPWPKGQPAPVPLPAKPAIPKPTVTPASPSPQVVTPTPLPTSPRANSPTQPSGAAVARGNAPPANPPMVNANDRPGSPAGPAGTRGQVGAVPPSGTGIDPVSPSAQPVLKSSSPLVESVVVAPIDARSDQLIRPIVPSQWIALLHKEGDRGEIARYWTGTTETAVASGFGSLKPWVDAGRAPYLHDPQVSDKYVFSPDGELLARISTFPSLCATVYSFKDKRVTTTLKLADSDGQAEVFGFINNDRLMIHRALNNSDGFEIWDARAGKRIKSLQTAHFMASGSPVAISADGSMLAVAAKDLPRNGTEGPATLFVYDLAGTGVRKMLIPDLDQRWAIAPTGMAFSPDGGRVALLFEQNGSGLLLAFRSKSVVRATLSQVLIPLPAQPPRSFEGSSIIWIGDDSLLLYAQAVISGTDGSVVSDLGITGVTSQYYSPPNTCELGLTGPADLRQIAVLKLKSPMSQ